jgi:hypothetical protein
MNIDITSPPLPESLTLSAGIDWVRECVGEMKAKADIDFALVSLLDGEVVKLDGEAAANAPLIRALVSALVERMEDRSTIALAADGLAQLRGRGGEGASARPSARSPAARSDEVSRPTSRAKKILQLRGDRAAWASPGRR